MAVATGVNIARNTIDHFLEKVAEGNTVVRAAKLAGIGHRTVYDMRESSEEFARRWDEAQEARTQVLEQEAWRRAVEGDERTRYDAKTGNVVSVEQHHSDALTIFLLKAARPDVYRDNARLELTGAGGGPLLVEHGLDTQGILTELAEAGLVAPRAGGGGELPLVEGRALEAGEQHDTTGGQEADQKGDPPTP